MGANLVSPILAATSVGGRPAGGTARLVSSQPAADRQQWSSGQPGGAPRHARHAGRFAGYEEFGTNNGGFCKVMMREGEMAVVKDRAVVKDSTYDA